MTERMQAPSNFSLHRNGEPSIKHRGASFAQEGQICKHFQYPAPGEPWNAVRGSVVAEDAEESWCRGSMAGNNGSTTGRNGTTLVQTPVGKAV